MLISFTHVIFPTEFTEIERVLASIHKKITLLEKSDTLLQKNKIDFSRELRSINTKIRKISLQIEDLTIAIKKSEFNLAEIQSEMDRLHLEKNNLIELVYLHLRSAHRTRPIKGKVIQEEPIRRALISKYYSYLIKDSFHSFKEFSEVSKEIANLEKISEENIKKNIERQINLRKKNNSLYLLKAHQEKSLHEVISTMKNHSIELFSYKKDQNKLAAILQDLKENNQSRSDYLYGGSTYFSSHLERDDAFISRRKTSFKGNFSEARSKLPWPVNGKLLVHFGESRGADTRTKWDGVVIEPKVGEKIYAVHSGKIVFSGWLRGMGNLIIIDHGYSYLTLYGNIQKILKFSGEKVKSGEIISSSEITSPEHYPSIYFGIRFQGKALDPRYWCH